MRQNNDIFSGGSNPKVVSEEHHLHMKGFLKKSLLFASFFLICRCILEWITPYHHGNIDIQTKTSILLQKSWKPDILFTGSSKILRGVKSDVFDSIRKVRGAHHPLAYNLGSPGTLIGENRYLIRNYIKEDFADSCKTIFVEWVNSYDPNPSQQFSERMTYWMEPREYWNYMEMEARMSFLSIPERLKFMWLYTRMFLINLTGIGRFKEQLLPLNVRPNEQWYDRGGYMAYHGHAPYLPNAQVDNPLAYFDTITMAKQRLNIRQLHEKKFEFVNKADIRQWNSFIESFHQQGIRIVLVILPMSPDDRVMSLTPHIPSCHLIDLSDPQRYPDLYDREIYFDRLHFNDEGARRFTCHLAEEWLKVSSACTH